ncbi:Histone-lysine N-methyltransferase SETMAR [Oopsacas minuta]|uniref:Histone-lysine N-methyltransferase SETMAR n=1 Tax=Oopsacas minuta TaxID=111878 RepID=A0AAV7JLN7_9METZ|nr:Histone-lysine N-methyltransferase SETMAR [Oopsacas minuta]
MSNSVFQQDGAPAHTSKLSQQWCQLNLPNYWAKEVWPGNSPDLSPIENLWAYVKNELSELPAASNLDLLKNQLKNVWADISPDLLKRLMDGMPARMRKCIDLNGEHFHAVIFYDFKIGLTHRDCHERLTQAFPSSSPSFPTVTNWYREFSRKRESLGDAPRTGRPQTATTTDHIEMVRSLVVEDRQITYNMIQSTLGISAWAVSKILHEDLGLHKLDSWWILHLLTDSQNQDRIDWCKSMLVKFDMGKSSRISQIQ